MTTETKRASLAPSTLYLTSDAYQRIQAADAEWIGTDHYMGLAYFWAYDYRFNLRDASSWVRVKTHRFLLDAGLEPDGYSPAHTEIIERTAPIR